MTEHQAHHETTGTEHEKKELGFFEAIRKGLGFLTKKFKNSVAKIMGWSDDHGHGHHGAHGHEEGHSHNTQEPEKLDEAKAIERLKELSAKEAQIDESELKGFELFAEKFKPELKEILYPCCATHSIKKTFPDSHITYVDIDKRSIDAMKKAGYDAHNMSALDFKPAHDPDLLVLFNQNLKKEEIHKVAEHVKPGKYVMCNDYHHAAEAMHAHPDFEFVAVVEKVGTFDGRKGENKLITENLETYFKKKEGKEKPFERNYEAGGIDDYYFFRRKQPAASGSGTARSTAE